LLLRGNREVYSSAELWPCFDVFQQWIAKNGVKPALSLMEVKVLFETLKVKLEATVVM